jgi:hypothetical protein
MPASQLQADWVTRVLGIERAASGASPGAGAELCQSMIETISDDIPSLSRIDPELAGKLPAILDVAKGLVGKADHDKAYKLLTEAAEMVAHAQAASRARQATAEIPKNIVANMKAQLLNAQKSWDGTLASARQQTEPVMLDFAEDSPAHAAGLKRLLHSYWQDLSGLLSAAGASKTSASVAKDAGEILLRAGELRKEMLEDDVLSELEAAGMSARSAFLRSLADIEREVQPLGSGANNVIP